MLEKSANKKICIIYGMNEYKRGIWNKNKVQRKIFPFTDIRANSFNPGDKKDTANVLITFCLDNCVPL